MGIAIELQGKAGPHEVTSDEMLRWEKQFPNINVAQCLLSMQAWLEANKADRPKIMNRFITNWLIGDARKAEQQWQATHREAMVGKR